MRLRGLLGRVLFVLGVFCLGSVALRGQQGGGSGAAVAVSNGAVGQWFTSGPLPGSPRAAAPPVPGYMEQETTHTQTLADGTHISQPMSINKVWRDAEGRQRMEHQFSFPESGGRAEAPAMVTIIDPVAGYMYHLLPGQKKAQRNPFGKPQGPVTAGVQAAPRGPVIGGIIGQGISRSGSFSISAPPPAGNSTKNPRSENMPKSSNEPLGTKIIDGLTVEGTRLTTIFPVGSIGNDREIQAVSETWFSSELGMAVETRTSDPRSGETITRLKNYDRSAPDPSLFAPPPEYEIIDARPNR